MSNFKKFLLLIGLGLALGVATGYVGVQLKKELLDEPKKNMIQRLYEESRMGRRMP